MSMFNGGGKEADGARPPRNPFARSDPNDLLSSTSEAMDVKTMQPFSSPGATPPDKCENVLASGAKWKGSLSVDTSVRVDGHFSGQIDSKSTVHVAEGSLVDGKIHALFVVIAGVFRGEIHCEQRVDLHPHSRVEAEIVTKILSVQDGAIFDGHVQMTQGDSQRAPARGKAAAETETRRERQLAGVANDSSGSEASDLE